MRNAREEMEMLFDDEKDKRIELREKWINLRKQKENIYNSWVDVTDVEKGRRKVIEGQWVDGTLNDAVTVSDLTEDAK